MPDPFTFDYAIVRVVPRVEREEFMNAGVVLYCATQRFLKARVEFDRQRFAAFASGLDFETVEEHLNTIPAICEGGAGAGPIGQMEQRARFHWLVAPRSTIIQLSPVHSGVCDDLESSLECLMNKVVRPPAGIQPD